MSSVANATERLSQPYEAEGDLKLENCGTVDPTSLTHIPRHSEILAPQADKQPTDGEEAILYDDPSRHLASTIVISKVVQDTGDSLQLSDIAEARSRGADRDALDHDSGRSSPVPLHLFVRPVLRTAAGLQFLPLDELESIVTVPNVCQELGRSGLTSNLESIALQVWTCVTSEDGELTTRRKLFVILCMMEKAECIENFIEEGIFDADLPFEFEQNQGLRRVGGPVKLFNSWKLCDLDTFRIYQGQVMAPYFKFVHDSVTRFREYQLHQCVVLPFVDDEFKTSALGNSRLDSAIRREGGYSIVRKVTIHSAHHDTFLHSLNKTSSEKVNYAVKELRKQDAASDDPEQQPDRETTAYKYLNCRRHPHIIQLLATFTYKGHLNLIFPWANGNLLEFWGSYFPSTAALTRNEDLARWMIAQFLGLAEAIHCIHHSEFANLAVHDIGPQDRSKTHGRHGDLKPENILWFKSDSSKDSKDALGTLLVSDLGSTEFHATRSKTIPANAAGGFTHTYKAPEFDKMQRVAPKADIWSFGCVLMQFLIWYTYGWEGVEKFAQARSNDSNLNFHADHFFNFDQRHSKVVVKASVKTEFTRLREDQAATDFILDLLDYVEDELLQLKPSKRATCDAIVTKFRAIQERCLRDTKYCMQRTKKDTSRVPTDFSDKTSVSFSSEMQEEYFLNINPNAPIMPSGSTTPRSIGSARVDDQTTLEGDAGNTLNPRIPPSNPSIAPAMVPEHSTAVLENKHTALRANEDELIAMPGETREHSSKKYRRASVWACGFMKGCFR